MQRVEDNEEIIERVAAIDVGKAELVVCVRVPDPARHGRRQQEIIYSSVCTRPENIQVLAEPAGKSHGRSHFGARVETIEYLGDRQEMAIALGEISLRAHGPAHLRVKPGDDVSPARNGRR